MIPYDDQSFLNEQKGAHPPTSQKLNISGNMTGTNEESRSQPIVGILIADAFDEWLEELGISLDAFSNQMMGSWVFNYIQALQTVGVRPILFCVSAKVSTLTRKTHRPTGAMIIVLPTPTISQQLKQWLPNDIVTVTGDCWHEISIEVLKRAWKRLVLLFIGFLSTPLIILFRELQREGCRSLLVQEYESIRFDLCVLVGRLKGVQVFGTFTGGGPVRRFSLPLHRLALGLCAGFAIGARGEANRVRTQYRSPKETVSLIYSPVDLDVFYPSPRDEGRKLLRIPSHVKVAMYHGRIDVSYKGLDVLLNAWRLVCQSFPEQNIRLILIGTGTDDKALSQLLADMELQGVEWHNQWVNDRDLIRRYLSSADVYVFPSRGDACPNAVIEAMACGLPIVASDVNGIADILEGGEHSGGVLVPPGDALALAEALGRILDNQSLANELGRRARCRVEESFSMEVVGKQLDSFLMDGRQ